MKILKEGEVIAYCLPAHTIGKTKALDFGVYGPFKSRLHEEVHQSEQYSGDFLFDQFYLLHMMKRSDQDSFTKKNILSSFKKSGLWRFNVSVLLRVPHPASAKKPDEMISIEYFTVMLETKRSQVPQGTSRQPIKIHRGFLDTTKGLVVSKYKAMKAIAEKEDGDRPKHAEKIEK